MKKKIITALSVFALAMTTFSNFVFADLSVELKGGNDNALYEEMAQCFKVYIPGISDTFTKAGDVWLAVPKGTVSTEDGYVGATITDSLTGKSGLKTVKAEFSAGIFPVADKEQNKNVPYPEDGKYDVVRAFWAASTGCTNADDLAGEVYLAPTDMSKDLEVKVISAKIITCDKDGANAQTVNLTGDDIYAIKANTSKVAKKNATEKFNAVQTAGADTFEVGFGANLTLSDAQNTGSTEVLWTLKNSANDKSTSDTVTYSYDTEGISGNIKVGLIVNGIAEADQANWNNVTATAGIVE